MLFALLILFSMTLAEEDLGEPLFLLESASKKEVLVTGANGDERKAKVGDYLEGGEVVDTSKGEAVRLVSEDGAQIVIGSEAKVRLSNRQEEDFNYVSIVDIHRGRVRAIITSSGKKKSPYKFYIRTKAVVMGVRGTDFIVTVSPEEVQIHTMNGLVEVGKNYKVLWEGDGVPIPGRHFTVVGPKAEKIEIAKLFDTTRLVSDLKKEDSKLVNFSKKAATDLKRGRIQKKIERLRKERRRRTDLKMPGTFSSGNKTPRPDGHEAIKKDEKKTRRDDLDRKKRMRIKKRRHRSRDNGSTGSTTPTAPRDGVSAPNSVDGSK